MWNLSYPVFTTTQKDEKLHIFDSNSLVLLPIWTYHTWKDLYRWHECIWTQIVENCNGNKQKIHKYSIAQNFLNNIGMLHLKIFALMRGIQLNKNLWNSSYPVLTTTQKDEKLHIFDSKSLVILSIWIYHTWKDMYRWHECNCTQIVDNCNENKQQNSEIFNCSQLL